MGPVTVKSGEAQVSDDEVEVVDEWTLPTESSGTEPPERSPPLHVPVIQRPADQPGHTQHKVTRCLSLMTGVICWCAHSNSVFCVNSR